ncbi:MAG: hypothetical protein M3Q49_05870 [Actinomycetota bacterium]|nr:hypothetical protein [Actinomycetota bacterium]
MGEIESLIFLLGAAVLLAQLARYANVPTRSSWSWGLAIGFTPGLPTVEISPEVIFRELSFPEARIASTSAGRTLP